MLVTILLGVLTLAVSAGSARAQESGPKAIEGVWAMSLRCGTCKRRWPAPVSFAVDFPFWRNAGKSGKYEAPHNSRPMSDHLGTAMSRPTETDAFTARSSR